MEAYSRNGQVILRKGSDERAVALGSQPLLISAVLLELWWLSPNNLVMSATVDEDSMTISQVANHITDPMIAYSAKYVPETGTVLVATDGLNVVAKVADGEAKSFKTTLSDLTGIDLEIDPSGKSIVMTSVALQQTDQGFVQQFVQAANKVIDQFFVYDFTLGPTDLPAALEYAWS